MVDMLLTPKRILRHSTAPVKLWPFGICKNLLQPTFSGPFFVSRASVFELELPKLPTGSASTDTAGIDRS